MKFYYDELQYSEKYKYDQFVCYSITISKSNVLNLIAKPIIHFIKFVIWLGVLILPVNPCLRVILDDDIGYLHLDQCLNRLRNHHGFCYKDCTIPDRLIR